MNTIAESAPPATERSGQPQFSHHTVDGQQFRVAIWPGEDATRTPLLLFNGIGSRIELLEPFVKELDPAREVISFDVPGAGESPSPRLPYRLWMLARVVADLLDQLQYDQVDVLGVSWGGTLAQQFAVQKARRCRKLILAATAAGGLLIPGSPKTLLKMATPRRFKDPNYLQENMGALYGGMARTDPHMLREFGRLSRSPSRRGYLYQQMALAGWVSAPFLPLIRQPTLILAGSDDPIVPLINARIMARLIPHSTLTTFDDGHLFLFSKAAECADLVDDFLQSDARV